MELSARLTERIRRRRMELEAADLPIGVREALFQLLDTSVEAAHGAEGPEASLAAAFLEFVMYQIVREAELLGQIREVVDASVTRTCKATQECARKDGVSQTRWWVERLRWPLALVASVATFSPFAPAIVRLILGGV